MTWFVPGGMFSLISPDISRFSERGLFLLVEMLMSVGEPLITAFHPGKYNELTLILAEAVAWVVN